jgi:hypothetical protein
MSGGHWMWIGGAVIVYVAQVMGYLTLAKIDA